MRNARAVWATRDLNQVRGTRSDQLLLVPPQNKVQFARSFGKIVPRRMSCEARCSRSILVAAAGATSLIALSWRQLGWLV